MLLLVHELKMSTCVSVCNKASEASIYPYYLVLLFDTIGIVGLSLRVDVIVSVVNSVYQQFTSKLQPIPIITIP
jgi:hypothetical protein